MSNFADKVKLKQLLGTLEESAGKGKGLFKITFEKSYHDAGKVLLKVRTATGKANFDTYAVSIKDLKLYTAGSKIFKKRLTGKLSNAVGARAEHFIKLAVSSGVKIKGVNGGKAVKFDPKTIQSVQNRSGHGIDLMAKNTPPPSPPKWYFFEGKSTLGGDVVPGLSKAQSEFKTWLQKKLSTAKNGVDKGGTWSDLKGDKSFYRELLDEVKEGNFEFIKADVFMDTAGKLAKEIGFTAIK